MFIIMTFRQTYKYDYVWVRSMRVTPWFFLLIKKLGKKYPVVLDFPVVPYDAVFNKYSLLTLSDRYFRDKLHRYTVACTYNGLKCDTIFGIKAIRIADGVDLVNLPTLNQSWSDGKLRFIAVANMALWHGYDRLLSGIAQCGEDVRDIVEVKFVGDGVERPNLEKLTSNLGLSTLVSFVGPKNGKELLELYNWANFGIGTLGAHRIGIEQITPIKAAEYLKFGLPLIYSYDDYRLNDCEFALRVPATDEPIQINEIMEYLTSLNTSKHEISEFALANLSWNKLMQPFADFLQNDRN